jgi:adenylate cyclase
MTLGGLAIGAITTTAVARSIAVPLRSIRAGLRAVEAGDLVTAVPIDDPGDLGELQRGFNDMVTGLRERRALEDLFGRYLGRDLAAQVVEFGPNLGGEVRTVSVLFVDVIGSTAMAEALTPEQVVSTMNSFYRVVTEVVDVHGGWIDKFEGDGAMCVFGAPAAQADHAELALRAALHLHHELAVIGLDAGIGVAAGDAVAGTVGTSDRFEYTVIGRPVNEAARLTDAAKQQPERVLASAPVLELAGPATRARWLSAGEAQLRGIERPIQLYCPVTDG